MATQANWELDPETRTKLAALQKKEGTGNDRCCDCGAPSPQWASPKFAIFICLQCAGTHRGLGVHISFVRSISMDAFKSTEIRRMQLGGNKAWQAFFAANSGGLSWDDCTIKERYDTEAGEEYKERLTAKCEDREFDAVGFAKARAEVRERIAAKERERERSSQNSRSGTPMGGNRRGTGAGSLSSTNSRGQSPAPGSTNMPLAQKAQNEAYFARLGGANASRPDDVPPSQGGKYAGFGSSVPEPAGQSAQGGGVIDELQKDPIGALTKGFGWFSATVTKQAKVVNESYIQPTAKNLAQTDFAATASKSLATVSSSVTSGAKGATEQFHKFVEGQDNAAAAAANRSGSGTGRAEPERKDFWDSFGVPSGGEQGSPPQQKSSVGTSAIKKVNSAAATPATAAAPGEGAARKKKDDGWGDDW